MRIEANGGCGCLLVILLLLGVESLMSRLFGFIYISFSTLILYILLILVIIKFIQWLLK